MRWLLPFLTLPLVAGLPPRVQLSNATVTWGSGVEPRGPAPMAHFGVSVAIQGKCPIRPEFRVWRVKIGDFPSLDEPGARFPRLKRGLALEHTATLEKAGAWVLQGAWPAAPRTEDRIVVEVRWGARHRGWASSTILAQALPGNGRRPGQVEFQP